MNNNLKYFLGAVLVIFVLAIGGGFLMKYAFPKTTGPGQVEVQLPESGPSETLSASAEILPTTTINKTVTGTKIISKASPSTLKYMDALKIYRASGYYFQFENCHGQPGSLIMKKGTKFMLDNRDVESHLISWGGHNYRLGSYSFVISTADKVGKFNITCDTGGAAQITVKP